MINIKKKSRLELLNFINFYKFNIFVLLHVLSEFIFFLYLHFKNKILLKLKKKNSNFLKSKALKVDNKFISKKFNSVKFKSISYNYKLRYTNKSNFRYIDEEKKKNKIRYYFLINFIEKKSNPDLIYRKFIKSYKIDKNQILFKNDIYSASERLSNLILFLCYHQYTKYNFIHLKSIIIFHIELISKNIEYHEDLTNNHILNNFRSLILASVFIKDKTLYKSSLINFIKFYSLVFDEDGYIKEGSSHYQLLVHSWIEDIYYFSINSGFQNNDLKISNEVKKIKNYLFKIRNKSSLFLILYKKNEVNVGDISPDLHPKFIINKISLFYNLKFYKSKDQLNNNWAIFNRNGLMLICSLSKLILKNKNTHHHNDLTSFVLIFKENPIVIDLGKYDYTKCDISSYHHSSFSHNSIFVDGLSLYPEFFYRSFIPKNFFNNIIKPNKIIKTLNGFKIISKGFTRYNLLSEYSRKFDIYNDLLKIDDEITPLKSRKITLVYNLDKKMRFLSKIDNVNMFSYDSKSISFDFSENKFPIKISNKKTFLSENYGQKITVNQLIINFSVSKKTKFVTKIKFF